ncbi:MAG: hypothetical protein ABW321_21200, partial [Polyangiales bacterium]
MSLVEVAPLTTVFLLSPARCGSLRANQMIEGRMKTPLAEALRTPSGAPLGDVFAFLSALYFRGKLAYARTFARPPRHLPGVFVITPGAGLVVESTRITGAHLRAFASVEVHHENAQFAEPLLRDARRLVAEAREDTGFVLLGSIASAKYVAPLAQVFGERLIFPAEFVGRGDMSRGGLLLRAAADQNELEYRTVAGAPLHGPRSPRLPKRAAKPARADSSAAKPARVKS